MVLPDAWDAARVFAAAGTQWRRAGMTGVPTGLDYAGVEAAARAVGVAWTGALLEQLRIMESAALGVMNDARS